MDRAVRTITGASVAVQGEPVIREAWLVDGYAGWITEGLLTPSRADELLGRIAEARRILE